MSDVRPPGRSERRPRLDDPDLLDRIVSEAVDEVVPRGPNEGVPAADEPRTGGVPSARHNGNGAGAPAEKQARRGRVGKAAVSRATAPAGAQPLLAPPEGPSAELDAASVRPRILPRTLRVTPELPPPPTGPETAAEPDTTEPERPRWHTTLEWVVVLVGALAVALVIRGFVLQAFYIPSASMEDTLQIDDRVLVNKLSYQFGDPARGDIIVFKRPGAGDGAGVDDLIKRVIAVEGEQVEVIDSTVHIDGDPLDEQYLDSEATYPDFGPVTVPRGHVFVMGDNRPDSRDSRSFGSIPESDVVGRAFVRIWPLGSLGFL